MVLTLTTGTALIVVKVTLSKKANDLLVTVVLVLKRLLAKVPYEALSAVDYRAPHDSGSPYSSESTKTDIKTKTTFIDTINCLL